MKQLNSRGFIRFIDIHCDIRLMTHVSFLASRPFDTISIENLPWELRQCWEHVGTELDPCQKYVCCWKWTTLSVLASSNATTWTPLACRLHNGSTQSKKPLRDLPKKETVRGTRTGQAGVEVSGVTSPPRSTKWSTNTFCKSTHNDHASYQVP